MEKKAERVLLGQISGAHGIKGDVLLRTFTAEPEDIAKYVLTDANGGRPLQLKVRRITEKGMIAHISGVDDRNAAEVLKGAELWVDRSNLPAVDEDEFYYVDLIGLAAVDLDGEAFGEVIQVANYGAGDLLEIMLKSSGKTEFVPFNIEFIPEVDIAGGRVVVAWPIQYEIANPESE